MNYSWTSIQWTCLVKIFRREFTVYTLQRNLVKLSSNLVGSIGWTWNRVFRVWRTHFICVAKIICWSSPFFLIFPFHITYYVFLFSCFDKRKWIWMSIAIHPPEKACPLVEYLCNFFLPLSHTYNLIFLLFELKIPLAPSFVLGEVLCSESIWNAYFGWIMKI